MIMGLTGGRFNIHVGPEAILLLLIVFIPIIHLFISTSRMKREAIAQTGIGDGGRGFPVIPIDPEP
jgi:hypothetical protein